MERHAAVPPPGSDERIAVDRLIRKIVARCPRRQAGSAQELEGQQILEEELVAAGLQT
jgi:hypothetical protein